MPTQSLTQKTCKPYFHSNAGGNMQTMTTGSGNGSVASFNNAAFLVVFNPNATTAVVTFKSGQPKPYSDRSATVGDWTLNIQQNKFAIVSVSSIMKDDSGEITVEADQACEIACIKKWQPD